MRKHGHHDVALPRLPRKLPMAFLVGLVVCLLLAITTVVALVGWGSH